MLIIHNSNMMNMKLSVNIFTYPEEKWASLKHTVPYIVQMINEIVDLKIHNGLGIYRILYI